MDMSILQCSAHGNFTGSLHVAIHFAGSRSRVEHLVFYLYPFGVHSVGHL